MRFEVELAPEAVQDFRRLKAGVRARVREAMETHLRHEPARTSRGHIKRLRGISRPPYRIRVDDVRIFYDVGDGVVEVLAIVEKSRASEWLKEIGEKE